MRLPSARVHLRRLRNPAVQLVAAVGVMVGGASLVAWWMVGIVLMVSGLLWAGDAVLRDTTPGGSREAHEDVLERWRRAR